MLAALLMVAALAQAQQPPPGGGPMGRSGMPPGRWWKRVEVAKKLSLTREQQQKLDDVFQAAADELIDAKGDVQKLEIALRGELDRSQLRRQEIQRIATQLNAARARLFERELMMLVDMRGVLDATQWEMLRQAPPPDRFEPFHGRMPRH
jgi:Spy/CpxP family protein refolding chaperone